MGRVVGVLLATGLLLAFMSIVVVVLNPFGTVPSVSVGEALWLLGRRGYTLRLNVSVSEPVQLLGVECAGVYREVVYDITPPYTVVEVPVGGCRGDTVTLHFSVGQPVRVHPRPVLPEGPRLNVVYGGRVLLAYGALPDPAVAVALPLPVETRVLVVAPPGGARALEQYVSRVLPGFTGDIVDAWGFTPSLLENYTTIVFTDVAPEPSLLRELAETGRTIVLHVWRRSLGEVRIRLSNGTVTVEEFGGDTSDIDYFGAHCVIEAGGRVAPAETGFIGELARFYGHPEARFAVAPSEYCRRRFTKVYMALEGGDIVLGYTVDGYYFAGVELKHVLLLAVSGFLEGAGASIAVRELPPFKGVKPLLVDAGAGSYMVSFFTGRLVITYYVRRPPVDIAVSGGRATLSIGVEAGGSPVWHGVARVRVEEYTYDMELLDVVTDMEATLPTNIVFPVEPLHAYLVYVNSTPIAMVVDEEALLGEPRVVVEYSTLCELFTLSVRRVDGLQSPLTLSVNGRVVAVLTRSNRVYEVHECTPGYYEVVVEDVYGNTVRRVRFRVYRIYESPLFLATVLSGASAATTLYIALRRRVEREVEEVHLVLYRLPDVEERVVDTHVVAECIHNLTSSLKRAPLVGEVLAYVYRRHPTLKTVADTVVALSSLLAERGDVRLHTRYTPELDDTVSVLAGPGVNPHLELYHHIVVAVLGRLGGVGEREIVREVMDVDLAAILGRRMLLLVYAPTGELVGEAVGRALTTLVRTRRLKLPFRLVGVAVVTEPGYVASVNRIIDDVLNASEEVANRIFRDMTVFTQIRAVPRESWLQHYIITAAPITRLAPLFAFAKYGAVRECNMYYRLAFT